MREPEDLARYLIDTTGESWVVVPLPSPVYEQTTAAYTTNNTTEMWAAVVDPPFFGHSLYVVAKMNGKEHTYTIQLGRRSIFDAIIYVSIRLKEMFAKDHS